MVSIVSAAIYARISSDPTGEALGVQRQLEDCRKIAEQRGWTVAEEYVDNDISAYRGKRRPAYQRMLEDLEAGRRDAVIAYNTDRLTRRPIELEEFAIVCEKAGVRQFATVTSDIDLGNDDGIFMARVQAAVAAKESGRKSERLRRKALETAMAGKPNGGYVRAFGYEKDRVTVVESEALIIRDLVNRFIAGESLISLTNWMQDQGVQSVVGKPWRVMTLRTMISSARIAGLRSHNGEVVAVAVWPAIITPAQREQVLAIMERRKVTGRRTPRRYLLSGLLRCGHCGGKLYSSSRGTTRRYVCQSGPDHQGCGRLTIVAAPVEEWISEAILLRLDTPALADAMAGRAAADDRQVALLSEQQSIQSRMDELATSYGTGEISKPEWITARDVLQTRLLNTTRQLDQLSGSTTLTGLVGNGAELRARWESLDLSRQAAIVAAILDYATIMPNAGRSTNVFLPERVVPTWRL
jgi:DNA invertase Pin-like site-specific DNA recombinase